MVAKAGDGYKVTLIDAGLGRPLCENLVGTPAYLAPELVRSASPRPSARSDIFAFGCVVYEMLFRQRAFPVQTLAERRSNLNADPGHHFLTGEDQPKTAAVRSALFSALEESPERRPAKIADLIARLDAACSATETAAVGTPLHASPAPASSAGHRILTPVREPVSPPPSDSGQLTPPNPNIHRTPEPRPAIRSRIPYVIASTMLLLGVGAGIWGWHSGSSPHPGVLTDLATADAIWADETGDLTSAVSEEIADGGTDARERAIPDLIVLPRHKEEERREPHVQRPKLRCSLKPPAGMDKKDSEAILRCCHKLPSSPRSPYRVVLKQLLKEVVPKEFPDSFFDNYKSFFECIKNIELAGFIPPKGVSYVCE